MKVVFILKMLCLIFVEVGKLFNEDSAPLAKIACRAIGVFFFLALVIFILAT